MKLNQIASIIIESNRELGESFQAYERDRKKEKNFVRMKFCCASNAAIKILKTFFNKFVIFPKIKDSLKKIHIFSDYWGSSRHFDCLFT